MAKQALSKKINKLRDVKEDIDAMKCTCPTCIKKGKPQKMTNFYNMNSAVSKKYPVCKDCIRKKVDKDDMKTVYKVLKEMNIGFFPHMWATAITKSELNPFGKYITMINSGLGHYHGIPFDESQISSGEKVEDIIDKRLQKEKSIQKQSSVDSEIISFWGGGLTDDEYIRMQKKYDFLKESYPLLSNIHIENLKSFVMPSVKSEIAMANNQLAEYKEWKKMADVAAEQGKLNVKSLSKSDLQGGIDSFSELCVAVEQAKDIIHVLPKVRYRPNDSADFIIWQEINYLRHMLGMGYVKYEEIYHFYEDMKNNFIRDKGDPFGIFTDDPTEKNRSIIENFIDIKSEDEEDDGE